MQAIPECLFAGGYVLFLGSRTSSQKLPVPVAARSQSRAMDALHKAQIAPVAEKAGAATRTFEQIMASCGTDGRTQSETTRR